MITKDHLLHIHELQFEWIRLMKEKYIRGVEEHGGLITDWPAVRLLDEAIMENIDQFVYLMTLRSKL